MKNYDEATGKSLSRAWLEFGCPIIHDADAGTTTRYRKDGSTFSYSTYRPDLWDKCSNMSYMTVAEAEKRRDSFKRYPEVTYLREGSGGTRFILRFRAGEKRSDESYRLLSFGRGADLPAVDRGVTWLREQATMGGTMDRTKEIKESEIFQLVTEHARKAEEYDLKQTYNACAFKREAGSYIIFREGAERGVHFYPTGRVLPSTVSRASLRGAEGWNKHPYSDAVKECMRLVMDARAPLHEEG